MNTYPHWFHSHWYHISSLIAIIFTVNTRKHPDIFSIAHPQFLLVVHGCLVVLWLRGVRVRVLLLLIRGHCVHPHVAFLGTQAFWFSHDGGSEVGRRHHDGRLHALLTAHPHLTAAAALLCAHTNNQSVKSQWNRYYFPYCDRDQFNELSKK